MNTPSEIVEKLERVTVENDLLKQRIAVLEHEISKIKQQQHLKKLIENASITSSSESDTSSSDSETESDSSSKPKYRAFKVRHVKHLHKN